MDLKQSLIENNSIRLGKTAADWKEAIRLSVEPLVESGAVTEVYYDEIIKATEELGAYYILCPLMAMPHARPGEYVKKDCFSFVTLKEAVQFPNDNEPVKVLVCLAATSSDNHLMDALPQVADLFSADYVMEEIEKAVTAEDIIKLIETVNAG